MWAEKLRSKAGWVSQGSSHYAGLAEGHGALWPSSGHGPTLVGRPACVKTGAQVLCCLPWVLLGSWPDPSPESSLTLCTDLLCKGGDYCLETSPRKAQRLNSLKICICKKVLIFFFYTFICFPFWRIKWNVIVVMRSNQFVTWDWIQSTPCGNPGCCFSRDAPRTVCVAHLCQLLGGTLANSEPGASGGRDGDPRGFSIPAPPQYSLSFSSPVFWLFCCYG